MTEGNKLSKFDVQVANLNDRAELQTWNLKRDFFKGTGSSYDQFINYLKNTDAPSKLKYVFNKDKLGTTNLKDAFKELLSRKKFEIFQDIPINLKENLLGVGNGNRFDLFELAISNINSKLYNFIN
ncbi:MAG: hypothetical protein P1P88_15690 [Bacteroidales bacterium]|nr:hypothetical protein [Bacteroidales bacterium]